MQLDRKRWIAVGGAVAAGIALAGAGFAVGRSSDSSPATRDEPVASPTPLVTTSFDIDGAGFCFTPIPGLLKDGELDSEMGGFEARYLGDGFALAGLEFGAYCHDGTSRALKTNWLASDGGWHIVVTQAEAAQTAASVRTPFSVNFWDGGFQFFVMAVDSRGGQSGPADPAVAGLQAVLDEVLRQLAPGFREECFERSIAKDWPDLAALGVGDPRPVIPNGFVPIRLDFTVTEHAAAGCPPSPSSNSNAFQFSAMFTDRNDRLLGIHISGGPATAPGFTGTFQPGSSAWSSGGKHFNLSWDPGLVSDESARNLARALDPTYDSICVVRSRQLSLDEIEAAGFQVPDAPPGFAHLGGNVERAFAIEPASQCPPGRETGFFADWMLSSDSLPGFIQVIARSGPQDPHRMPPPYDESRMIYWKDARGAEYWVVGAKVTFPRETLVQFARAVDPTFDESKLTAPPPP